MAQSLVENFACNVFNEAVMRARLPKDTYKSLRKTIDDGQPLEESVAQVVANAMKDWAMEKGATHYTHWFQPMTGITAEKHDSFLNPDSNGCAVAEFSGKNLIKGESDASSFPSGGLRATFEARGYTSWDPTSYAFVKGHTLYIPTAFCSYSGEVLDKKTPLLRSMQVINTQACRLLKAIGKDVKRVVPTVGAEQEYFLIDKSLYDQRPDLIFAGRTLMGASAPKGQEMERNYYRNIKERVSAFMEELDKELWSFGIFSKTKHNEAAPAQHELAPVFCTCNLAADQNQLTMEMMKKIAKRHDLYCLLHEKPFNGVNGSGKHNNWAIATDKGENLLEPGNNPAKNTQFLLIFSAVLAAVDQYGDLLRLSVASASNDYRLGGNEAPPAIISVFVGDEIEDIIDDIEAGRVSPCSDNGVIDSGVSRLPLIYRDATDRNRTSPFAFTGNKFEFRMPGSSQSISGVNVIMNAAVAEIFRQYADRLEKAEDVNQEIAALLKESFAAHRRIIFNGNNYSEEWVQEAKRRGLANNATTVEALQAYVDPHNIAMLVKNDIYAENEIQAHYEIKLEKYSSTLNIEALTMIDMANRLVLPAVMKYSKMFFEAIKLKAESGLELDLTAEKAYAKEIADLTSALIGDTKNLEQILKDAQQTKDTYKKAAAYEHKVSPAMVELRKSADALEKLVGAKYWPMPTYSELLFRI